MKLSVIGCGYLGAVHAAGMAHLGHEVIGIDTDPTKVAAFNEGRSPFFEKGLDELLQEGIAAGRLRFATDTAEALGAEVHFICVGTPQQESGAADLQYVEAAVDAVADLGGLVVGKSTVPVGTAARLAERVKLIWNPEFLRESMAVQDTLAPDRIVYGVADEDSSKILDAVYEPILKTGTPRIITDYATAELVKAAANAFLATKISFINAMAELADASGADVTTLAEALGHDERIGPKFLRAGIGFGGGCLPKDLRGLVSRSQELGVDSLEFLNRIDDVNTHQRERALTKLRDHLGTLEGKHVAVLGGAFKPDTDDIRDSPALAVAQMLHQAGASVSVYDPQAGPNIAQRYLNLEVRDRVDVADADAVAVLTEWKEFKELDPAALSVRNKLVLDGRNCLNPERWRAAGFTYLGMGRE